MFPQGMKGFCGAITPKNDRKKEALFIGGGILSQDSTGSQV
jgi:hypothetical protein